MPFETRREFLKHSLAIPLFAKLARSEAGAQNDDDEQYRPIPDGVIATQSRLYGPNSPLAEVKKPENRAQIQKT